MTILNIGPIEFIAILIIMFLVLGPEGMVRTAYNIGAWIRKTVRSPLWGEILGYSREIRDLPTKIVRETGLDEDLKLIEHTAAEATLEARKGIEDATKELNESMKEAGSIQVNVKQDQASGGLPVVDVKDSRGILEEKPGLDGKKKEEPAKPIVFD